MSVSMPPLGRLIDTYRGDPATLWWVSIGLDGRAVERTSDNEISWSTAYDMWIQAELLREVFRVVGKVLLGRLWAAELVRAGAHGTVVAGRPDRTPNGVVTAMLTELQCPHQVYGTVAWLGVMHPETGLFGDVDTEQRAALLALAERHRPDTDDSATGSGAPDGGDPRAGGRSQ